MTSNKHLVLALLGSAAALAFTPIAAANADETRVLTLTPSTHGNPEGVAVEPFTGLFFVGATGDGTIYRGRLGSPTVEEFIPGATGRSAIGLEIARGRLYVAGGATGTIVVYDLFTRRQIASFATGTGGFINDLVVTATGDVFATDSFRPTLWHVTAAQVRAGSGTPEAISVAPEIAFQAGAFNLNGIVALDANTLVVVQSSNGALFRIDVERRGRRIQRIDADPVLGGDGMILDRGRLVVVQGASSQLTFLRLDRRATRATVLGHITDPTFRTPSTVARDRDRFVVVNADFATSTVPFTVSAVPARAVRGGDDLGEDLDADLDDQREQQPADQDP